MSNLALGTACYVRVLTVALLLSIIAMPLAKAQTYTVRYSFQGYPVDGQSPYSGPVRDAAGNLYGTTYWGEQRMAEPCISWIRPARRPCCTVSEHNQRTDMGQGA